MGEGGEGVWRGGGGSEGGRVRGVGRALRGTQVVVWIVAKN